jgi:hypothetical protein
MRAESLIVGLHERRRYDRWRHGRESATFHHHDRDPVAPFAHEPVDTGINIGAHLTDGLLDLSQQGLGHRLLHESPKSRFELAAHRLGSAGGIDLLDDSGWNGQNTPDNASEGLSRALGGGFHGQLEVDKRHDRACTVAVCRVTPLQYRLQNTSPEFLGARHDSCVADVTIRPQC